VEALLITLTREEVAQCQQAAALRWQLARASGVVNQRKDTDSSDGDIDFVGIRAELAVAKALKVDYSPQSLGIDAGVDFFYEGIAVDVKATFHAEGHLLFKNPEAFVADIAILVTATEKVETMAIKGWISRDKFLDTAIKQDFGKGDCYIVKRLSSIENLWLKVTRRSHAHG